jgi:meromycolic acid enoyl-[acyl-carrier-protein] reductase
VTGLLEGRRLVVTGVLTEASLASAVTRLAVAEGADVLLTSPVCRAHRVTARVAPRLGVTREVLELDVELDDDLAALAGSVRAAGWDRVDGVLHAIAYLPEADRSAGLAAQPWDVVAPTMRTTAWSLPALVQALRPLLGPGSSVVALHRDPARAWPGLDWLGVAQAALGGAVRGLAAELEPDGVRVNAVAAGPSRTMLGRAVPGAVRDDAPLGWDPGDPQPVARAVCVLLSDWLAATSGAVVHVDGGVHALG